MTYRELAKDCQRQAGVCLNMIRFSERNGLAEWKNRWIANVGYWNREAARMMRLAKKEDAGK